MGYGSMVGDPLAGNLIKILHRAGATANYADCLRAITALDAAKQHLEARLEFLRRESIHLTTQPPHGRVKA